MIQLHRSSVLPLSPSRGALAAAAVLLIAGMPVGCTSTRPVAGDPPGSSRVEGGAAAKPDARTALTTLAERQATQQGALSSRPPVPPGVDAAALEPADAEDRAALLPLDQTLSELRERAADGGASKPAPPTPDRMAANAALRLYTTARMKLLRNELAEAITDFQSATRLDPGSVEPWEGLGEAQLRAGQLRAAVESFTRAIDNGSTDPLTLLTVARAAQQRDDHERAARVLAGLFASDSLGSDPGLPYIASAMLGRSLLALGRLDAASEALASAIQLPEQFTQPTRYREELGEVYRQRAELCRDLGDAACRLGRFDLAAQVYARAASLPSLDSGSILARRVYASLAMGRSAQAALAILDELAAGDGRIEDRHIELIRYLAASGGDAGPPLARAIQELRDTRQSLDADSIVGRLARAAAAALPPNPPEPAREILRRRLAESPADVASLEDLIATYTADATDGLARELCRLAERSPMHAPLIGGAVVRPQSPVDGASVLASLGRVRRLPAASLVEAVVAEEVGEDDRAVEALKRAPQDGPLAQAAAALRVSVGAALGRWDLARAGLESLQKRAAADPTDRSARAAEAVALAALQRFDAAWELMRESLPPESDTSPRATEDLRRAADLAVLAGEPAKAEPLLRRAIEADPYVEAPYVSLIRLHADGGPLADRTKLFEMVRALREAVPSARGLRFLRAQELARAGQFAQSEPELLALAHDDPEDAEPFQILVLIWDALAKSPAGEPALLNRAVERMDAIRAEAPRAPWPLIAAARARAAAGRKEEAVSLLAGALESSPTPADRQAIGAVLEDLLRSMDRAEEADQRAAARLRAARPTINNTLALAALLARTGDGDEAARLLRERLPGGIALTASQTGAVAEALSRALRSDRPRAAVGIAAQLARLAERPEPLHYRLWYDAIVQAGNSDDAAEFVRAADAAGVIDDLLRPRQPQAAQDGAAAPTPPTPAELAYSLGVILLSRSGEDEAIPLYELALSYDPGHPMACNNLGYTLLEQGRELDRAERLLETAHRALPSDANITDSIGWLRYKTGILTDEVDADGRTIREGAVTLLRRAAELQTEGDGTIIDHLGDALWLAGDRDAATRQWRRASRLAQELLGAARQRNIPEDTPAVRRLGDLLASVRAKQRAVADGREPEVAPQLRPAAQQPAAPPAGDSSAKH